MAGVWTGETGGQGLEAWRARKRCLRGGRGKKSFCVEVKENFHPGTSLNISHLDHIYISRSPSLHLKIYTLHASCMKKSVLVRSGYENIQHLLLFFDYNNI